MLTSLPPTSPSLMDGAHRPYFLWWTSATVADLHARLADPDPEVRAYWMGALLREANTRDVWIFVTPEMIRNTWDRLTRYLGRSRAMWAYLLDLPLRPWPPVTDIGRQHRAGQLRSRERATDGPVYGGRCRVRTPAGSRARPAAG